MNYININQNYDALKSFRKNYDFDGLIQKSKQKLSSFLGTKLDTSIHFSPINFFFFASEGMALGDGLYIDLNLMFKLTEEQRIEFIAHEFFHNYREVDEKDFDYSKEVNNFIDVQSEGVADMIDKSNGFDLYLSMFNEQTQGLLRKAIDNGPEDMKKMHDVIVKYKNGEMTEDSTLQSLSVIVANNGHFIGYYMASQIVKAGYKKELIKSYNKPVEFYILYNKAAKKLKLFQFSEQFMAYLSAQTKKS